MAKGPNITFISAGAGSGKTHRLTDILHRELRGKQVRPAGVIVTTFTRKAAAELRARVREHILGQGDFMLANSMGQARIGTINSVCGQLAERFAFEAGLATEQHVLDEIQGGLLLDKAIDDVLDAPAMEAFLKLVGRLGLHETPQDGAKPWKRSLQELVNQIRSNDVPFNRLATFAETNATELLAYFPRPANDDLGAQLGGEIARVLPELERVAIAGGKKNTNNYLTFVREFHRKLQTGNAAWGDWLKLSKEAPEAGLRSLVEPIAELAGRVDEHPMLRADIASYLHRMFDLAAKALQIYDERKRELGVLDFTDQEHHLLELLDHPVVAQTLEKELDLLMVDEFQDTSPIQLTLFLKLARFAKAVYWVGDIKQAIYGFRGSDSALMQSILAELPALGGTKEVLPDSWRSRPELVALVNAVFGHAFEASLPRNEIELCPVRKAQLPGAPLANWILGGKNAAQEASALVGGIRKLVDSRYKVIDKGAVSCRDVRFGDIAVLARSHAAVSAIASALSAQGVPAATQRAGLLRTPEATLALACLRRLNDTGDTIATAEIVSLCDCLEPEVWVADRLRHLQAEGRADDWLEVDMDGKAAHPVLAKIATMRKGLTFMAPKEALQMVVTECGLAEMTLRWDPRPDRARTRLVNLEALMALASEYEELCASIQSSASIAGLTLWLAALADEGRDALPEPAIDAVKVLTHHAAKGLEWPVVLLTDLSASIKDRLWSISAQSAENMDIRNPLDNRFIRYWPWPFGSQRTARVADEIAQSAVAASFRRSAVEESKRLLYVSMTRARDLLVIARSSRNPTGEWLDCVDAPWLQQNEDAGAVILPNGDAIQAERWSLDPLDEPAGSASIPPTQIHWFAPVQKSQHRLPLSFNPSLAETAAGIIVEQCRIGARMVVHAGTDMNALGQAIHAGLALSFTDRDRGVDLEEIASLLEGFGVGQSVDASALMQQISALHDWISERWPQATTFAEYPVQSVLDSGVTLNGRVDLLLDTIDGWVLIDHKSSLLSTQHWQQLADEYGAQLGAYARAVERASQRPVRECWLFLPVAGACVQLGQQRMRPDTQAPRH